MQEQLTKGTIEDVLKKHLRDKGHANTNGFIMLTDVLTEDLSIDSLDMVEFVNDIEDDLNIRFDDDDKIYNTPMTVQELIDYIYDEKR